MPTQAEIDQYNADHAQWQQDKAAYDAAKAEHDAAVAQYQADSASYDDDLAAWDACVVNRCGSAPQAVGGGVTFDPDRSYGGSHTFSDDNQTVTANSGNSYVHGMTVEEAIMQDTGKYYWETVFHVPSPSISGAVGIGVFKTNSSWLGSAADQWAFWRYSSYGKIYQSGSDRGTVTQAEDGDVLRHLLDLDAGTYTLYLNDKTEYEFQASIDSTLAWQPQACPRSTNGFTFNFAADDLQFDVPAGHELLVLDPTQEEIDAFEADKELWDACRHGAKARPGETIVYCGVEPVAPASDMENRQPGPTNSAPDGYFENVVLDQYKRFEVRYSDDYSTENEINTAATPMTVDLLVPEGLKTSGLAQVNSYFYNENSPGSSSQSKRLQWEGSDLEFPTEVFAPGDIIRVEFSASSRTTLVGVNLHGELLTQEQIDDYLSAKTEYDDCIARGGESGNPPAEDE